MMHIRYMYVCVCVCYCFSGIYFNVNLILVLVSVVLTVIVLNFHYRGPKKSRVPAWCRRIVIGKIGKWLGFHFTNSEQLNSMVTRPNTNVFSSTSTHSIEQILLKMQTQFDPSRINDEHLKVSILREILECQRLLLTIHARKQYRPSYCVYDIYEEWKILAIIVDRICFIFYLISMLSASIIFFVREPILKRNGNG